MIKVRYRKIDPRAITPHQAHPSDAGSDLHSLEDAIIHRYERALISTGLSVSLTEGTYGRIAPRSGLAVKHGLDVLAGVIDVGYLGEIKICLINLGGRPIEIKAGDRIAQLIIERCEQPIWEEVEELAPTQRSENGFGSSGVECVSDQPFKPLDHEQFK